MGIDPQIEKPARKMLGHAMRGELDDLAILAYAAGDSVFRQVIAMCLLASGYVAVDVCGRWPTDPDIERIGANLAAAEPVLNLAEDDVRAYLSRTVLGGEPLEDVFPAETASVLPLLITASLLASYRPADRHWWEYLDQIWDAAEAAERTDKAILPALILRVGREARLAAPPETRA